MTTRDDLIDDSLLLITGELSGGEFRDLSSSERSIVNSGGTSEVDATLDRLIMRFSDVDDYAYVDEATNSWIPTSTVTYAFWYRKLDLTSRTSTAFGIDAAHHSNDSFAEMPTLNGNIYFRHGYTGVVTVTSPADMDEWSHWVFEWASGYGRIYRDNVMVGELSTTASRSSATSDKFGINKGGGSANDGNPSEFADFLVLDRQLTGTERTWLANDSNRLAGDLSLTVVLDDDEIAPDGTTTVTVYRTGGDGSEIVVTLASSSTGVATVPASVTILEAELSATATVTAVAVGATDISGTSGSATDSASLSVAIPPVNVGRPDETDVAGGATILDGGVLSVGKSSEDDEAKSASLTGVVNVGMAEETDIPISVTEDNPGSISVGSATEASEAKEAVVSEVVEVGRATESNSGESVSVGDSVNPGQSSEQDTANGVAGIESSSSLVMQFYHQILAG